VPEEAMSARFSTTMGVAAMSAIATTVVSTASAQERSNVLESRHHKYESPQNFAFELRFSPYRPDIDGDPALHGATPYHDIFGSMPRLLIAAEFDWQALRIPHVGTLGPGISVGYTSMSAPAPLANQPGLSGENTSIDIFPFYAVAVLRFDVVTKELRVPLVPYAKAGVGYALWRAYNDGGTSQAGGVPGKGHSFGTQVAAGVALHLNAFDEYAARNLDNTMGVNNTYLFWEYYSLDLTGFSNGNTLRVGSSSWAAGLAFEF
jgi:hypothetical protein